ncbi:sugar efflux transporter [uncultured Deinococcus sp.]|uniref:sugar efflux transporter n=1 Tax=uncultured Deinococcus sp. TaxID=158789 RepID=UPI002589CAE1|nr:sugar efflux transporter [uncultured Deinococcus sp.]
MTVPPPPPAPEVADQPSAGELLRSLARLPHALELSASVFLLGFGLSLANPFMALFGVNEVHMTPLQLGIFLTLNAVASVLISTLLARFSDRLPNRKPLVLLTLGAGATAYLLLSSLRSYPAILIAGMVFLGTGAAAFPQLFSFARARFADAPGDLPERALTVLRSVFSLSWVVGPGLGAVLLAVWDFRGTFLATAACFVLAALALLRVAPRPPQPSTPAAARPGAPTGPSPIVQAAFAFVLYGMSMSMGLTMFPLFVTKTLGGTQGEVGFLVGLCALLEIPAMLALVALRRLPPLNVLIRAALLLFVVHFALVYFASGTVLLVLSQVVRAAVLAVMAGLGMAYFQELMPGRFSVATTLFANTNNVGAMLSGIVSGACAQLFGYRSVYLLCAALTLTGWIIMQLTVRRQKRHLAEAEAQAA